MSMSAISVVDARDNYPDALEVFHRGIARTLQDRAEGEIAGERQAGLVTYRAEAEGLSIAIDVVEARERIASLTHGGEASAAEVAVLVQLRRFAEGATPRELVEHGLTYVIERLRDPDAPRPVAGILTPRSAGPCFRRPRSLMRALREVYVNANGAFSGDNDFDRPFSATWLALGEAAKHARLRSLVDHYRDAAGLATGSMEIFEIDQYDRVVVMFADDVAVWDKPPHLLALERWLREETGERIEVFVEIAKDSNRIRRL